MRPLSGRVDHEISGTPALPALNPEELAGLPARPLVRRINSYSPGHNRGHKQNQR
jgi:hypothetical protein